MNRLLDRVKSSARDKQPEQLERLGAEIQALRQLSPQDARFDSLMANLRLLEGREKEAGELFDMALAKAPTEHNALLHKIDEQVKAGDYEQVLKYIDILLRRWPEEFERLKPMLLGIAGKDGAGQLMLELLASRPPYWRQVLKLYLTTHAGLDLAKRLLLMAHSEGSPLPEKDAANILYALLRAGKAPAAYRTFLLTLKPEEKTRMGYVFDPGFTAKADLRPFTWSVRNTADADVTLPWRGGRETGGLMVQFRNAPTRLATIRQILMLPPSSYKLRVRATARLLTAPRGLFWDIQCREKNGKSLVRLQIPEGSYKNRTLETTFSVPAACLTELLVLRTGLSTPTWSARYQGEAIFHEVTITRQDSEQ